MVLTPFHYPVAYATYKLSKRKLPLYDLTFGSFIVDIEVPLLFLLGVNPARLILHSLLGALIVAPLISLPMYPITHKILKTFDISVPKKPRSILAIIVGSELHNLLDTLNHTYNPLLWPIENNKAIGLLLFTDPTTATIIMHTITITTTIWLLLTYHKKERQLRKTIEAMLNNHTG